MKTPFSQLNLISVEHVWVEYHVAESLSNTTFPVSHEAILIEKSLIFQFAILLAA
jgi:hypothetical protein